jgi:hypothetical protein
MIFLLSGCGGTNQLQTPSYQFRLFDTSDKEKVLRATISTLQGLGFVIDNANFMPGDVSGIKFEGDNQIQITIFVRSKGSDRTLVSANAQFNVTPVKDPQQYQDFFTSLEKLLSPALQLAE